MPADGLVADRLDVVAVRVVYERTVVVRVIDRAWPGRSVVLSAGGQGCRMKPVHHSPALGGERNVDALGWRTGRHEEPRPASLAAAVLRRVPRGLDPDRDNR